MKNNYLNQKNWVRILLVALLTVIMISCQSKKQEKKEVHTRLPSTEEIFKMMDVNEDGLLIIEEIKGPLKKDFDKVDTNNDGYITKQELEKSPKPRQKDPPKRE